MNMDKANYTKVRFNCKEVIFLAPLLTKMHTDPQYFLFGFKLCYISRYLKMLLSKTLKKGNFRSDIP